MRLLINLKLVDPDGRISLTNFALYVVLGVFVFSVGRNGTVDVPALVALLTGVAAYRGKSMQADKRDNEEASREERVQALKAKELEARVMELTRELDRVVKAPAARQSATASLPPGLRF